ncbi:MAG: hypothetical protein FT671_01290 [Pantoea sp. Brub]|nr:hypothetical protein [Pantoea sp. Brub]
MQTIIKIFYFLIITLLLNNCQTNVHERIIIPQKFKQLNITTDHVCHSILNVINNKLNTYGIEIIGYNQHDKTIPTLVINFHDYDNDNVSDYTNRNVTESQRKITLNAALIIPKKGVFPIQVKAYRHYFFNNYPNNTHNNELPYGYINEMFHWINNYHCKNNDYGSSYDCQYNNYNRFDNKFYQLHHSNYNPYYKIYCDIDHEVNCDVHARTYGGITVDTHIGNDTVVSDDDINYYSLNNVSDNNEQFMTNDMNVLIANKVFDKIIKIYAKQISLDNEQKSQVKIVNNV